MKGETLLERQFRRDIEATRERMLHRVPAWAFLAYKLDWELNPTIKTAHTDGVSVEINPAYWGTLKPMQKEFLMAHEIGHPALKDLWRRGNRDPLKWNEAADYRLNLILRKAGFEDQCPNILIDDQFEGMSAEEIYSWREAKNEPPKPPPPQPEPEPSDEPESDDKQQSRQDDEAQDEQDNNESDDSDDGEPESDQQADEPGDKLEEGDGSDGDGEPSDDSNDSEGDANGKGEGSNDESTHPMQDSGTGDFEDGPEPGEDGDEAEWDLATRMAERQATKAGNMPNAMIDALRESREPAVDWVALTRQFVDNNIQSRMNFATPNRRYLSGFNMTLPGPYKEHVGVIVVFVDTSGSTYNLREQFGGELRGLVRDVQPEKLVVVYIDTEVQKVIEYTPESSDITLEMFGGGSTEFQPAFDYVEQHNINPLCAFYLTDLEGSRPDEPRYPVMWVVPQFCGYEAPFGELVKIP